VRLKLINENWEKYADAQDELEDLGHDTNSQQQRASLRRFIARRGLCDNGTNFVGAKKELRETILERKSVERYFQLCH
jgi:hypothetical protein